MSEKPGPRAQREQEIADQYGRSVEQREGFFGFSRIDDVSEDEDQAYFDLNAAPDATLTDHGGHRTVDGGPVSITADDVGDRRHARAPDDIRNLDKYRRESSQWDTSSLSKAAHWLRWESDFARNNRTAMEEIADLMALSRDGQPREGHASPLGSFNTATQLAGQNASVYKAVYDGLEEIRRALTNAAEATERIRDNYRDVEELNRLSAEQMKRIFADAEKDDK